MRVDVKKLKSLMVDSGLIAAEKFDEIEKKAAKSTKKA